MMRSGFTLTEILVALGVIAVLVAIAVPVGRTVTREANRAACLQKLRTLSVAVEGYTTDHGGRYPPLIMGREGSEAAEDDLVLEEVLLEYVADDETAFQCPADHEHFDKSGCSYFWNHELSGQPKTNLTLMGIPAGAESIPLITDKEAFHGDDQGTNFLYADMSAGNRVKFETGSR